MNLNKAKKHPLLPSMARRVCVTLVLVVTLLAVGCSDIKPLINQRCGTTEPAQIALKLKHVGGLVYQAVVMNETIEFKLDPNKAPHKQIRFWVGVLLNGAVDIARLNMSVDTRRVLESLHRCSTCSTDGKSCVPSISFDFKRFLLDEVPELAWQHLPGKAARVIDLTIAVVKICGICPIDTPIPAESQGSAPISALSKLSPDMGAQALYNAALFSSGPTVLQVRRAGETEFSRIVPAGDADGNGEVNANDIRAIITNTNVACPLAVSRLTDSRQTTDEILLQMLYMVRTGQFVPCSEQDATRVGRLAERLSGKILKPSATPSASQPPGAQGAAIPTPGRPPG